MLRQAVVVEDSVPEPGQCAPLAGGIAILDVAATRSPNTCALGKGPRETLASLHLQKMSDSQRAEWLAEARLDAIIGLCRLSIASVRSGVRCFVAFSSATCPARQKHFPPSLDTLLQWSVTFRCSATFGNYLGYVRTACLMVEEPTEVFNHAALKRAKGSILKSNCFKPREKLFITRDLLVRMIGTSEDKLMMKLFVFAYAFLLRVPSEALPAVAAVAGNPPIDQQSVLAMVDGKLVLTLRRRKNKQGGSRLVRSCWCKQCSVTCPVHVLGPMLDEAGHGGALFPGITASGALATLRSVLQCLDIPHAALFRTHDFRRGHAKDLQLSGAPLWQILEAGEWRSPAFLTYLDMFRLETDLVVQAHLAESDDE